MMLRIVGWILKAFLYPFTPAHDQIAEEGKRLNQAAAGMAIGVPLLFLFGYALPFVFAVILPVIVCAVIGMLIPRRFGRGLVVGAGWVASYLIVISIVKGTSDWPKTLQESLLAYALVPGALFFLSASANRTPSKFAGICAIGIALFAGNRVYQTHPSTKPGSGVQVGNVSTPASLPAPSVAIPDEGSAQTATVAGTAEPGVLARMRKYFQPQESDEAADPAVRAVDASQSQPTEPQKSPGDQVAEKSAASSLSPAERDLLGIYIVEGTDYFDEASAIFRLVVDYRDGAYLVYGDFMKDQERIHTLRLTEDTISLELGELSLQAQRDPSEKEGRVYLGDFVSSARHPLLNVPKGRVTVGQVVNSHFGGLAPCAAEGQNQPMNYSGTVTLQPGRIKDVLIQAIGYENANKSFKPANHPDLTFSDLLIDSSLERTTENCVAGAITRATFDSYTGLAVYPEPMDFPTLDFSGPFLEGRKRDGGFEFKTLAPLSARRVIRAAKNPYGALLSWSLQHDPENDTITGEVTATSLFIGYEFPAGRVELRRALSDSFWEAKALPSDGTASMMGGWEGHLKFETTPGSHPFKLAIAPGKNGAIAIETRGLPRSLSAKRLVPDVVTAERLRFQLQNDGDGLRNDFYADWDAKRYGDSFIGQIELVTYEGKQKASWTLKRRK